MNKSIFITGTDTNIGKTIVSALLMIKSSYSYWKPIQTGAAAENDTETVRRLSRVPHDRLLAPVYSFPEPFSPHLAAETNGVPINLDAINMPKTNGGLIIEGAGGILTPLNEREAMLDLIKKLKIDALVVSKGTLGAINHASLTLQALSRAMINVRGVIIVGEMLPGTAEAIAHYGKTTILMRLPWLPELSYCSLKNIKINEKIQAIL